MNPENLFVFDWEKVKPHVMEALNNGKATLRDGVAYSINGKNNYVIAQHMPLKNVSIDGSSSVEMIIKQVTSLQNVQLAATALSTGVIVGAIAMQTMYLANKIDKLQQQIDIVSKDVHSQNVLYFMGQLSEYFGMIESARILLLDKELAEESSGIAEQYMAQLAAKRNALLSLIDNLIDYADRSTERHAALMLDFINMMFDLLPKSIYLEVQLYERHLKFKLADHIKATAKNSYDKVLGNYKNWCNNKSKAILTGKGTEHEQLFHSKENILKQLFNSEINQALLSSQQQSALMCN